MYSKILSNQKLLIVTILGCIFFLGFVYFIFKNEIGSGSSVLVASTYVQEKNSLPLPVRLKIPKININAVVEHVGMAEDGSVGVPKGPAEVAWFNLGPAPGENGNAIIDGHAGWKNNTPAIFDNLYKLQKGDKIYVENEEGITITFVVRELKNYAPNEYASGVFGSNDDQAHLNLITCTGAWDKKTGSHAERLVVFTDRLYE